MVSERASRRTFIGVSAIFFAVSAAVTVLWCASMSTMGEMRMPGGWTMSMLWMRMPEQSWPGAAASFFGMWVAMMVSMMLPSLAPMLWRYRQGVAMTGETRLARLTALLSLGYFLVWAVLGMAVFILGVVLAVLEVKLRLLCGPDSGASRGRGHEPACNGRRDGGHHRRTSCARRSASHASGRSDCIWRRTAPDRARRPIGMRNADRRQPVEVAETPRPCRQVRQLSV